MQKGSELELLLTCDCIGSICGISRTERGQECTEIWCVSERCVKLKDGGSYVVWRCPSELV